MHLEILAEDSSGATLLSHLMPKLLGPLGEPHTWRLHAYRGVGRVPKGLQPASDPAKRTLLDQLQRLLRGYVKTPGIDAVVVVVDTDGRDYRAFLEELRAMARDCGAGDRTLYRLAIEEIEAWYLGDRTALLGAYPRARKPILDGYVQDSVGGTWELLARATHPEHGRVTWSASGHVKHEWAERIGPRLDPPANLSPSFAKFRDGVRRLVKAPL
jgi:hypothetical protein